MPAKPNSFTRYLVVFLQLALGYGLIYLFMGQRLADDLANLDKFRLANLPPTALSAVERHAGSGEIVRIQGKISIQPPLTGAAGEKLAFKAVTQTDDNGEVTVVEDEWWIPGTVVIEDGENRIPVQIERLIPDPYFLEERAKGNIRDGKIPEEVAAWMGNDFKDLKPIERDDIRVYTINQGAPVTVYGVVERRNGEPVVRAPKHQILGKTSGRLILSALPPAELSKKLRFDGYLAVFICFGLALPMLIVVGVLVGLGRMEKKDETPDLSRLNQTG